MGTPGAVALGVVAAGLLWTLMATDGPDPSPQLLDYATQPSVRINTWLMLIYVAYVVTPLIRPAYRDCLRNPLLAGKIGSGLIAGGFLLSLLRAGAYPVEWFGPEDTAYLYMLISYVSTAAVVTGLAVFAYARRKRKVETDLGSALSID